jgi:hypothetical protein
LTTERTVSLINLPAAGTVEKAGLIVTALLAGVNYLIGSKELALGTAAGGLLFTANFMAIRFLVNAIIGKAYTKGFGIFAFVIKMVVFLGLVAAMFVFAKVDLFGFFIGVTGVVIVIIGVSLKGSKDGTL